MNSLQQSKGNQLLGFLFALHLLAVFMIAYNKVRAHWMESLDHDSHHQAVKQWIQSSCIQKGSHAACYTLPIDLLPGVIQQLMKKQQLQLFHAPNKVHAQWYNRILQHETMLIRSV